MCGLCRMLWGWWDHCTDFYVAGSACFHLPGKWLNFVKEESDLAGNGGTNTVLYHVEPANVFMLFPFFFREGSCQLCCRGGRGGGACEGVHGRPVATLGAGGTLLLQQTVACPQSPSLFHLCSCLPTPPRGLAPWLRCRFAPREPWLRPEVESSLHLSSLHPSLLGASSPSSVVLRWTGVSPCSAIAWRGASESVSLSLSFHNHSVQPLAPTWHLAGTHRDHGGKALLSIWSPRGYSHLRWESHAAHHLCHPSATGSVLLKDKASS